MSCLAINGCQKREAEKVKAVMHFGQQEEIEDWN